MAGMDQVAGISTKEVLDMRLADVDKAAGLIKAVLADGSDENKVYLSAMVSPNQKRLVEGLASINRAKQADVLRAIIDEWCEVKLKETGGR
jgi:hypothetical protein